MALILHGDGLPCFTHGHHHHSGQHQPRHHSPRHEHAHHNNNKTKNEYQPLINETSENPCNKNSEDSFSSSFIRVSRTKRSSSISSYPNHSRSNSISRSPPFSNCTDAIRRNSHATIGSQASTTIKIKEIGDLQRSDCVDVDLNDDKVSLISNNTKELKPAHDFAIVGASICPIHQYVHRDSSEHTPISSSDSEDIHDHHRHRTNYINSHNHSHNHHSHDFSTKNINIQAAVIHVLGDFIQSIGVFISAIIIKNYPNAKIAGTVFFKSSFNSFILDNSPTLNIQFNLIFL